jgi:hypothetical protein
MMEENEVDCGVLTSLPGSRSTSWSIHVLFLLVLSLLHYFGSVKRFIMVGTPLFDHFYRRYDNDEVDS